MTPLRNVRIGSDTIVGADNFLLLIAGPCQIQSYDHCCLIAEAILSATRDLPVTVVFKSSFDKANRTSVSAARGPGLEEGIRILEQVRQRFGIPVLTDVHSPEQARAAGAVIDVLQIPAFLCRQTDLLLAAGETGKAINIKKGQFLHPSDMRFCAEKVASTGNENILLCERGTCFGYRDLIVDMRSLLLMAETGYPVVFDATHSVQSMGGAGGTSGGSRQFIPHLARAAVATGVQGVFLECHEDPDSAPSDAASMLPLSEVPQLVATLSHLHQTAHRPIK